MTIARPRNSHRIGRLAAWFGVFAVLLRCVIAPGLMPDLAAAAKGEFKLVICSGNDAGTYPVTPSDDSPLQPHGHDHALCPYAASVHATAPVDLPIVDGAPFEHAVATLVHQDAAFDAPPHRPGARAPPLTA